MDSSLTKEIADYAFGLTLVAMLLLSPITWNHIYVALQHLLQQAHQIFEHAGLGNKVLRQKQFAKQLWLLISVYLLPTHQVYAPIILQIKK